MTALAVTDCACPTRAAMRTPNASTVNALTNPFVTVAPPAVLVPLDRHLVFQCTRATHRTRHASPRPRWPGVESPRVMQCEQCFQPDPYIRPLLPQDAVVHPVDRPPIGEKHVMPQRPLLPRPDPRDGFPRLHVERVHPELDANAV